MEHNDTCAVCNGNDNATFTSSASTSVLSSLFSSITMFTDNCRNHLRTSSIAFILFISMHVLWSTGVQMRVGRSQYADVMRSRHYIDFNNTSTHGLRAIVTGLEHSGTTLTGSLLFNSPCVIGAHETGYLISDSPKVIERAQPWFEWNVARSHHKSLNYRLMPSDIQAMRNTATFFHMYHVLRHRSYLFNDLNDEEYCDKPYQMIDKTPRYVYPQYFERILDKTPGVPVVVTQKNYETLQKSWNRRKGNLTREFYDETFNNVWKMKEKYPNRILLIHEEDLMEHPDAVMTDVFYHVGLEWKTEYLQMEGLLKKFSNDTATAKWIKHWKFSAGKHSPA